MEIWPWSISIPMTCRLLFESLIVLPQLSHVQAAQCHWHYVKLFCRVAQCVAQFPTGSHIIETVLY